jgi:hypothetical protein
MTDHLPCYGKLLPSPPWRQSGNERSDGVFRYVYPQPGTVRRPPDITVNLEAWARCAECHEFSTCLQLSTAKGVLGAAVRN